jgi:nucleoid-associated protein YgaU
MFARILVLVLVVAVAWAVVAHASTAAGPERAYTVRPGDTLWSIAAARYGGDPRSGVWKIAQRNDLPGGTIRAGQHLVLP